MSTKARKSVQWGVKIGRTIRPLPKVRKVSDAYIYAAKFNTEPRAAKASVVYRNSDDELWRTWIGEHEQPTQLTLDLSMQSRS